MNFDRTVWVIDQDPIVIATYEKLLGIRYELRCFSNLELFNQALGTSDSLPDLLIVELTLTDNGLLGFLASPRRIQMAPIPFLVVSSVDDLEFLRLCFQRGAADHLSKPFGSGELIVKVERILFREFFSPAVGNVYGPDKDSLEVDPTSLRLLRSGKQSPPLTSKEFQIFTLLRSEPDRTISREKILARIWGEVTVGSKTLDVHLFNLRKKLAHVAMEIYALHPGAYKLATKS